MNNIHVWNILEENLHTRHKTYVWSFLGRLSHWLLVTTVFSCYITSFYEELLELHVAIGIVAFGMFLMKIIWGLIGPKYARWSDFKFGLNDLINYFVVKIKNRYREIQPGHNAASSWFAFLVTWFGIILSLTGFLLYGIQEGNGIFSFLNQNYYEHSSLLEDIHIYITYLILFMIFSHVSGVLIEQFYHKTHMVMAMISGYKRAKGNDIFITPKMMILGTIYIIFILMVAFYTYYRPNNIFIESKFEKINYKKINYDFYFECSDCHNLYAPFLLPAKSWKELIKNQHDHFEEDLELSEDLIKRIENYLIMNSAEKSTKESAYNILREIGDSGEFTITKTNYWKNIHKDIPQNVFENNIVEKKTNCVACHRDFEYGIIADKNIVYPPKAVK